LIPGFTAFVSTKKIESKRTNQISNNKYLSNCASSARVLPLQGTCPLVSDIYVYWDTPIPSDNVCKWRMRRGENSCQCRNIHWKYKGELTHQECNRIGSGFLTSDIKSGAASPIKAPCWIGDLVDCPDSACPGPNPNPADCANDLACGPRRKDCTSHDCQGACTSDLDGNCYCWCSV
jgi:hypothetical protein